MKPSNSERLDRLEAIIVQLESVFESLQMEAALMVREVADMQKRVEEQLASMDVTTTGGGA